MALNYDVTNLTVRFGTALNIASLRLRITELLNIFRDCTVKEQQVFYVQLVDHTFGTSAGSTGWNIKGLSRTERYDEFEVVLEFLRPHGPLFQIAYRLLADVYTKYEYNIAYLPSNFQSMIHQATLPAFFMDKLQMDPVSRQPMHLRLNSFEYYMFHFVFHLVSPWQQRLTAIDYNCLDTVYLHLSDHYLAHLLPIETSNVLPVVTINHLSPRSPTPQVTPVRVSKLFKPSAMEMMMAATPSVSQPHAEIWRSEMMLLIAIYFWFPLAEPSANANKSFNMSPSSSMNSSNSSFVQNSPLLLSGHEPRATLIHLRVARTFIKHVHFFANNVRNDGTAMDEMRRSIRSVSRGPIHNFLCHNIHHWPLDSSFKHMLETYLCYIQPWRYLRYSPGSHAGRSTNVTRSWAPFISENLDVYNKIIIHLITRFTRMDLSSPRHADMVHRLSKVISEPDLPGLLLEADTTARRRGDADDVFLFTNATERKVLELLQKIRTTVALINDQEQSVKQHSSSSTIQSIHEWLFGSCSDDYTSFDRQATLTYLEQSVPWLCSVFKVNPPDPPELGAVAPVQPSMLDPVLAQKRAIFIKYGGNPDLQPIRTNELASLVRLLHRISTSMNEMYGPQISELWYRQDLKGQLCRQLLAPPCQIHHFHKTGPGNPAPLVTSVLPPRVCLRPLASHKFLFFMAFLAFIPHLLGRSPPLFYIICLVFYGVSLMIKAVLAPFFNKDPKQVAHEPIIPLDLSYMQ